MMNLFGMVNGRHRCANCVRITYLVFTDANISTRELNELIAFLIECNGNEDDKKQFLLIIISLMMKSSFRFTWIPTTYIFYCTLVPLHCIKLSTCPDWTQYSAAQHQSTLYGSNGTILSCLRQSHESSCIRMIIIITIMYYYCCE